MTAGYLKKILTAHVYEVATVTALDLLPALSQGLGNRVYLKREDMQSVFSFKLRGAYNKMAGLSPAQRERGVICSSAGNHAQGVALAAARLGCRALIVMPSTTPQVKIDAVREHGGAWVDIVLHGGSYTEAFDHAKTIERTRGLSFVHAFDDPDVIAGQGTIGMEILHQHTGPIHAIFVAGPTSASSVCRPSIRMRWRAAWQQASASPCPRSGCSRMAPPSGSSAKKASALPGKSWTRSCWSIPTGSAPP
jgi:threonine dehydratase